MEQKRHRRKKVEVENIIENSVREAIVERGYSRIRISDILEKACIEPGVFYNRYKDLDDCLDKIVRKYDYWLNDSLEINSDLPPAENLENIITSLIDALDDNPEMQQLLVWELSEYNKTTLRTSNSREEDTKSAIEMFDDAFHELNIDYRYFSALFIGGIYYLILHKKYPSFCTIDFSKQEAIERLKYTIHQLFDLIFNRQIDEKAVADREAKNRTLVMMDVAKSLFQHGVDVQIIKKTTGLSVKTIRELGKDN